MTAVEQPFQALHFVHDGQPDFASRSREFCWSLCNEHGVVLDIEEVHGKPLAQNGDLSWEAACRHLRYRSLATREGPFLTAHTADDQAETLVMRLLDGAGLAGLGGIHPERQDGVLRPLLGFERSQLRAFLSEEGFDWVDDPTNFDGNRRAVIRRELLPVLLQHNKALLSTLSRTAARLREDEDFLNRAVTEWMARYGNRQGDSWPLEQVQRLHPALAARFFKRVQKDMSGSSRRPRSSLIEECLRLVKNGTNEAHVDFAGGWSFWVLGNRLWLCPSLPPESWSGDPSEAEAFCPGLRVSLEPRVGWDAWNIPEGAVLRSRMAGDRFEGRSLKKLLAGTGHPPWVRNRWPLLTLGKQVLAVVGMKPPDSVTRVPNLWLKFRPECLRAGLRVSEE